MGCTASVTAKQSQAELNSAVQLAECTPPVAAAQHSWLQRPPPLRSFSDSEGELEKRQTNEHRSTCIEIMQHNEAFDDPDPFYTKFGWTWASRHRSLPTNVIHIVAEKPQRYHRSSLQSKSASILTLESEGGLQQTEFFGRSQFKEDDSFVVLARIKKMAENGAFDEAQRELEQIVHKSITPHQRAMACLLLAELSSEWGAASASYTIGIMERGSMHASDAVQIFRAEMDEYLEKDGDSADEGLLHQLLREALYWKALNFASVAGLGGCARYSLHSAFCEADDALRTLQIMCAAKSSQSERLSLNGIQLFVKASILFCRATALQSGHFTLEECQGKTHQELWQLCLNMYQESYRKLVSASRAHLNDETIKTVTMIALCNKLLGHREDAIEWATTEFDMRVRLFGHINPRTQRAQQMLHDLLGSSIPANSVSASLRSVSVSASVRSPDFDTATGDRTEVQETQEYALERVASHEIVWELNPFALSDSFRVSAVLRMFEELGLVARFAIPIEKLRALVVKCRDSYHSDNAFHNWCHAWSVTHVAYMLLSSCTIRRFLREEEVLSVMVACLVHDIHHPGVNSDYLIKSGSALALQFPYPNLLEQMHWSHAKQMFADDCETNILENVTPIEKEEILLLIHDGIMATDMQNHKAIVASLATHAKVLTADGNGPVDEDANGILSRAPVYDIDKQEDRRELLQSIVHAADLSGQTLKKDIAYSFGRGVLREFHTQSQRESEERLPATSFMKNLHLPLVQAKAQLGFLNFVVEPLWNYLGAIFPEIKERHKAVVDRLNEIDFERLDEWEGLCDSLQEKAACSEEKAACSEEKAACSDQTS